MASGDWAILTNNGTYMKDMTESQATKVIRMMFKTIYNRELRCTKARTNLNSMDIMILRNGNTVAEYDHKDQVVYIRRKGKEEIFAELYDWETIYNEKPSKWWTDTYVG